MTVYYVDPAASGDDDGGGDGVDRTDPTEAANWTNAWEDIVSADNNVSAGDIIYCRGTQTLSAGITFDTAAGDTTSGNVHYIGCDSSGNPRQGQFVLDADNTATFCLDLKTIDFITIENFSFINSASNGFVSNLSYMSIGNVFRHCLSKDHVGYGFNLNGTSYSQFIDCIVDNAGSDGFGLINFYNKFFCCVSKNNGGTGFYFSSGLTHLFYCLAYDNTDDGFYTTSSSVICNCVSDGNNVLTGGSGLKTGTSSFNTIWACRFTNNDVYGIEMTGAINSSNTEDYCVFDNNDDGPRLNIVAGLNSDASPADDGYVNASTDDYNIKTGAEIRSTAYVIDWA